MLIVLNEDSLRTDEHFHVRTANGNQSYESINHSLRIELCTHGILLHCGITLQVKKLSVFSSGVDS